MSTDRDLQVAKGTWKEKTARPAQPLIATRGRRGPTSRAPSSHTDTNRHWAKTKVSRERRASNRSQN